MDMYKNKNWFKQEIDINIDNKCVIISYIKS